MSLLADARGNLYEALQPVLPGRVDAYPPPPGRAVAPKIWIGEDDGEAGILGTATNVTVARYPVVVVYDGAVHAQVAGLDDLKSAVLDAIGGCPGFRHDGWRSGPVPGGPFDGTLRAAVVAAVTTIAGRTLCPPPSAPVSIPSAPIQETVS